MPSESLIVEAASEATKGNKKICPNNILKTYDQGKMMEVAGADLEKHMIFKFERTDSKVVLFEACNRDTKQPSYQGMTLKSVITDHKISHVYKHEKFPAGHPPQKLVPEEKLKAFLSSASEFDALRKKIQASLSSHS